MFRSSENGAISQIVKVFEFLVNITFYFQQIYNAWFRVHANGELNKTCPLATFVKCTNLVAVICMLLSHILLCDVFFNALRIALWNLERVFDPEESTIWLSLQQLEIYFILGNHWLSQVHEIADRVREITHFMGLN